MIKRVCFLFMLFFAAITYSTAASQRFTLVIDAGHGGKDAGALGSTSKEKDINLKVALAFGRYVERNCPDVKVLYTRKSDVFVTLQNRAGFANSNKADLFISIHTNALERGRITRGFETYTLGMHRANDNLDVAKRENSVILVENDYKKTYKGFDPNSSESYIMFELIQSQNMVRSVELAKMIQNNVCSLSGRQNKGVHQAGFLVLRETSMPSCLVELGFITTPDEERDLNTTYVIDNISKGLYNAFINYKNKYDNKVVVPYKTLAAGNNDLPQIVPESNKVVVETPSKKKNDKGCSKNIIIDDENIIIMDDSDAEKKELADHKEQNDKKEQNDSSAINKNNDTAGETNNKKGQSVNDSLNGNGNTQKDISNENRSAAKAHNDTPSEPVFKIQIIASDRILKPGDKSLKGLQDVESYDEGGLHKYTYGSSANYNEIYNLRKTIAEQFPQSFIIAFKNGKKTNVVEAIKEFKASKNKKKN